MSQFNIIAVLATWCNSLFGTNISVELSAPEFAEAFKEAAEKSMADLKKQISDLTLAAEGAATQATAIEAMQKSLESMSDQLKEITEQAATAKAGHELEIKNLRESFTKQLAGEKSDDETQDHAIKTEGSKDKKNRVVLEGWKAKNNISKITIN